MTNSEIRPVGIVMEPVEAHEAKGVLIRRTIGSERLVLLDPFLLLDHLTLPPSESEGGSVPLGFPRHPHRGIETLTYVISGSVHHKDSLGNGSAVGAGGSQWMTAGKGIFHEEMFAADAEGCEGLQIWFNLPASQKFVPAAYVPAQAEEIPEVALESGARVRVVAGTFGETHGAFSGIAVKPTYLDVHLPAGASLTLPTEPGQTAFAYLYRGTATFGPNGVTERSTEVSVKNNTREVSAARLVLFKEGNTVHANASGTEDARFIFVAAHPLNEPVLQYRSVVLNNVEQMRQALDDLEQGTFDKQ